MSDRVFAVCSLVLVMLIWGTSFVVTKVVLAEVPPFLLALLRFLLASAILMALVRAAGGSARLPRPVPIGTLTLMGLTGVTLFFVGANLAIVYTTVTDASLIQGSVPAVTAALAVVFLGERPGRARAVGIGVSILGVVLLVLAGGRSGDASNPLLGNLLTLGSVLAWSVYTILAKRLERAPQLAVTAYSSVLGTLLLVPAAAYDLAVQPPPAISAASWLTILYLGSVASALAYLLWNRALQVLDASQVATFINLIPLVGVATAALVLGETLVPEQILGGALVLLGVWLSSRSPSPEGRPSGGAVSRLRG